MSTVPVLRTQKQEDQKCKVIWLRTEFKASLGWRHNVQSKDSAAKFISVLRDGSFSPHSLPSPLRIKLRPCLLLPPWPQGLFFCHPAGAETTAGEKQQQGGREGQANARLQTQQGFFVCPVSPSVPDIQWWDPQPGPQAAETGLRKGACSQVLGTCLIILTHYIDVNYWLFLDPLM